jgi:MFS family permease
VRVPQTFASLQRHRNYRLFFAGQLGSVVGNWTQNVATAWLILRLTHSAVAVGLLAFCQFVPFTVFGLFTGAVVDRLDPRRTVIGTQSCLAVFAGLFAALTLSGVIAPWEVFVFSTVVGTVRVLDGPARQALVYQIVGRSELANAVGLNSSIMSAGRIVGPALGGLLVAAVGVGYCFLANAVLLVPVIVALVLIRAAELHPLARRGRSQSVLRGSGEALAYALRTPAVWLTLVTVLLLSTVCLNNGVLLPLLAKRTLHGGPGLFGGLSAAMGLGSMAGALILATLGRAGWKTLIAGTSVMGVAELLLAPQDSVPASLVLLFVIGAAYTLWTANANSMLQIGSPEHLQGRAAGLYFFAFIGGSPLGGLLAGWLVATGGTELAFAVAGVFALVMTAVVAVRLRVLGAAGRLNRPVPETA